MNRMRLVGALGLILLMLPRGDLRAAVQAPVAVSPGSATGALIEDACPTFSWGLVPGAHSYELVVYPVREESEEAEPAVRQVVAGSASSWTPSLGLCLQRGERYAWSVRAVDESDSSTWAPPRLFEVKAGPTELELKAALAVVQEYLAARRVPVAASGAGARVHTPPGMLLAPPPREALPSAFTLGLSDQAIQFLNPAGEGGYILSGSLGWSEPGRSINVLGWNGDGEVRIPFGLRIPLFGTFASGSDLGGEAYEILDPGSFTCGVDERGRIAIMAPSAATTSSGTQDSLCYCGLVEGRYSWWCLNP